MTIRRWALLALVLAGSVLFSMPAMAASTTPTFSSGQTVDVFTTPFAGTSQLTITLDPTSGQGPQFTVPLTYIKQITVSGLIFQKFMNLTSYDEFSFKMPIFGANTSYGALINAPTGGAVFTRFVGYPTEPNNFQYGTSFIYHAITPGQLPEVPFAASFPLIAGVIGIMAYGYRQRYRILH